MFFYRRPYWGIGIKILMILGLIVGGTFLARSAFQAGLMQGAAMEAGDITAPYFLPHAKGYRFHPLGGSFFTVLAIFFGGLLLIKLITSIIGLIMFKRWKADGGSEWEDWKVWKSHKHHHYHCEPYHHGPWGPYPSSRKKGKPDDKSADDPQADQTDER